jgi:hypothetical protein
MSYVQWKIVHYPSNTNGIGWQSTGTEITDVYNVDIQVARGDKKDTFKFTVDNSYGRFNNFFKPNDKVEIFRVLNTTVIGSNDIIMSGVVRDIPTESSGKKDEISISGYNFSEAASTGIVFIDPRDKDPMEIIQMALTSLEVENTNFKITWDSVNNPVVKSDNITPFPKITQKYFYKPLSKVLDDMTSGAYTADGEYTWWIDKNNKLQVRSVSGGSFFEYNSSTDIETVSIKEKRDTSKVKNFIILKGGTSPDGKPIQVVMRDYTSISKNGMKFQFGVSSARYAESLNQQDVGGQTSTNRFPTSYPFTTTWAASFTEVVEGVSVTANSTITVNNNTQYNAVVKKEAETRLRNDARAVIDNTKYGKLQVDIGSTAGKRSWTLGDRVSVTIPRLGISNKILRVSEIQFGTVQDNFSLEEDVGTI